MGYLFDFIKSLIKMRFIPKENTKGREALSLCLYIFFKTLVSFQNRKTPEHKFLRLT